MGPLEARKGGGGGSATGWCSAATMVAAAAFQDAGRGVGAWLGVEWRWEELEREVAKWNGERELGRKGEGVEEGSGGACAVCGGVLAELP